MGQLQLIKWEVARSSESLADDQVLTQKAKAHAAMEEFSRAQGVAEKIGSKDSKASALVETARAMAETGAKQRDEELLKQSRGVAEKIGDEPTKAIALKEVAKAAAVMGDYRLARAVASKQVNKARELEV